jgi:dihydroxy-acid dehydratase
MPENPYDIPSDPAERHSAALTDGPDRAPARAMLKGTGYTDEDLRRPIIGVALTWIETMPCNLNQRDLAQHVKPGIRDALSEERPTSGSRTPRRKPLFLGSPIPTGGDPDDASVVWWDHAPDHRIGRGTCPNHAQRMTIPRA